MQLPPTYFFEYGEKKELFDPAVADAALRQAQLKDYLCAVWRQWKSMKDHLFYDLRWDMGGAVEEEEQRAFRDRYQPFLKFEEGRVKAQNYIGVIQHDGLQINILPKVFARESETVEQEDALRIFHHILYYFSYCRRLKFPSSTVALEHADFDNFLDVIIFYFAVYTSRIVAEQPYQHFDEITEETAFFKGRLAVQEYITRSVAAGNWQQLYSTYEPFVYDNLLNRTLKYTCTLLLEYTKSNLNRRLLSDILFILDEVTLERVTYEATEKIKLNAFFEEYATILNMCRMFLASEIITMSDGSSGNFCFLLPMEVIFEDFISGFLEENISIAKQARVYLARRQDNQAEVFMMKHDIFLKDSNVIMDTKYKIRSESPNFTKHTRGVAQGDVYQLLAYALRRNARQALLIYPAQQEPEEPSEKDTFVIQNEWIRENRDGRGPLATIRLHAADVCIVSPEKDFKAIKESLDKSLVERFRKLEVLP